MTIIKQPLRVLALTVLLGGVWILMQTANAAEEKQPSVGQLEFTDTDINAVIGAVAKLTGKNFIIDPRVKGKVTVITHQAMTKDEVYQVFLSLLKVHGFAAIPGKNIIKIVPEVSAKQDAIKTVDHASFSDGDELVTQVIAIKHVSAAQLVPILRPLVPQRGHLAAYTQSNVLIISDSSSNVARLLQIISRIDRSVNQEIEMIPLENATASDVVRVIKQLKKTGTKDAKNFTLVADDRTNSILLSGDKHVRLRMRGLITHLDMPLEVGGEAHVIYLKYAKAKDLVTVLTGVSKSFAKAGKSKKAAAATSSKNKVFIQADEATNSLVINAPAGILRSLRSVVRQLDIRRAQVLVEAIIAEVSYTKSSQLGVEWVLDGTAGGDKNGPIGVLNFGGLPGLLEDPPAIGTGLSFGLGTFKNGNIQFGALIRALAGDSNNNILSTPTLVTMDNEEASIVVGQNVPFITGSYTGSSSGGGSTSPDNPFTTVERKDVGLTLKIKPQINEGDAIKLEITQEVSTISSSDVGVDLITNKREWSTTVMVDDGQVLVLGGLIEDQLREGEQKVPGLGDIPILGWLFKSKTMNKTKINLMAFIHPVILKDRAIQNEYTGKKYNYIRAKQQEMQTRGASLFSNNEIPTMPEFEPVPALPPRYLPIDNPGSQASEPPTQ